ncbi:hypothetical protein F4802DRAFT_600464 [Xylaria palmicola]|nr:hypothetical protein F4802DRAFT_600464 [Xylaria palmicola]
MQPNNIFATAQANSVDDESIDTDPRPDPSSTALSMEPSHIRRQSQSSVRSESRTRTRISCVSRESMSGEDCARQRFIVWAAVKRNKSVRMAASERLRCPLLRCGERFDGHEEMLRHLTQCQHLSTGEYVCYECMKVERFNDKKCTCFFGQPTKRRRIINMAKIFFSNIGSNKVRREVPTYDAQACHPNSDPFMDMHQEYTQTQADTPAYGEGRGREDGTLDPGTSQLELKGTQLLELDSTPLLPTAELDAISYNTHPSSTPDPLGSCIEANEAPLSPMHGIYSKPQQSPILSNILPLNTGAPSSGARRPSLALNTQIDHCRTKLHTTYLTPSSPVRSSSHGISPITPWTASSKSSNIWSAAPGRETVLASPITPSSANAHPTVPQEDRTLVAKDMDMLACPEDPCHYIPGDIPELQENNNFPSPMPRLLSDPLTFLYDPKDSYPWLSSQNSEFSLSPSVNMMFTDPNVKTSIHPDFLGSQISGSETKGLVEQVWDALTEHFSSSMSKLSMLQNNALTDSLRAQTPRTVASAGLARFRKSLNQNYTARSDPLEYLCFIHLMYAVSLVLHEDSVIARSRRFYEQAVAYSALFDATHRNDYYQIVTTIWQQHPQEPTSRGRFGESSSRPTGNKGKEPDYHTSSVPILSPDPLIVTGQSFLDELENIMVNSSIQQPMEVISSELWSAHFTSSQSNLQGATPLIIASTFLVQDLCRRYHDSENFLNKLKEIGQNARAGYYGTIRKLELELMQTGKNYFASNDHLDQYLLQVRDLCDQIYSQPGTRPRAEYHSFGISLVDSLIRSVSREPQQPQERHAEYPFMPYSYDDEFLRDLNKAFVYYPIIPVTQQPAPTERAPDFGSSLNLTALHAGSSDTQLASGSPNPLPIRSDASETPSETYTVSPAPLSDVPLEAPTSNSFRPTPPSKAQSEGAETPGPSTLASSGQKVEANERCEICGYRPKGDPQWFKGSMAKHKKMQHSPNPPIIYKCPFPGCNSEYKNRRDNLRQHQIEKNHFVGDEASRPHKRKRGDHT